MAEDNKFRASEIPDYKKNLVEELKEKIKKSKTLLIASTKGLPSSQFHAIKKKLRDKADVKVAKKSLVCRAIDGLDKGALKNIKEDVGSDVALFFSDLDPFELSGVLGDNETPAKAKAGDVAPEDITVEPGPTELPPGPAISELGAVGLKVAVEDGKLAIKQSATIVKAGEVIDEKVASVMGKLDISPMKVGFLPLAAYDSQAEKVYRDIKIDKEGTLEELRESIAKSLNMSVNIGYINDKTVTYFIAKAGLEEKALASKVESSSGEEKKEETKEESQEESKEEEKPVEEVKEETKEESNDDQKAEKEDKS